MNAFEQSLHNRLQDRQARQLFRQRPCLQSPQGASIVIDGKSLLNFSSNDYLGLASHPGVIAAYKEGLDRFGAGSGASHLVCGHGKAHHDLEAALAEFTGRSRALVFSSGFMANIGILTTLAGKGDAVFEDRLNHASLLDGGLFSGARFRRYAHRDIPALEKALQESPVPGRQLAVSDGVFSMDGDIVPLPDMLAVCEKYHAVAMIDDAHGFGCLAQDGGGTCAWWREQGHDINERNLPVLVGTFGKALGTAGAFVAGSEALVETLIQFCRPYIYTTAMPPATAHATLQSLAIVRQEPWRREQLAALIHRFRQHCEALGLVLLPSATPIQAIMAGSVERCMAMSQFLRNNGIFPGAIRPPTVPAGTARLRLTFSAVHTDAQLQQLLDALDAMVAAGLTAGEAG